MMTTMKDFKSLKEFDASERAKLRWMLRVDVHQEEMVRDGVALKFGREWRVNVERLEEFLRKRTLRELSARSASVSA